MQPLQDDLRDPAAQDNSITHAAAAPCNIHAAIAMCFAASVANLHVSTHDNNHAAIPMRSANADSRNA